MAIEQTEPQEKALIAAQFERATAAQPKRAYSSKRQENKNT